MIVNKYVVQEKTNLMIKILVLISENTQKHIIPVTMILEKKTGTKKTGIYMI